MAEYQDDRHDANYRTAFDLITAMPPESEAFFNRLAAEASDLGTALQLPPEQMLSGLAVVAAAILLCHIDPRDEPEVNRLVWFAQDAIQTAVAMQRLQMGAIGERPDGSWGIKTDA